MSCIVACAKKALFELFQAKQTPPQEVTWFMQAEYGIDNGLHVHLLLVGKQFTQTQGKWICRNLSISYARWLVACLNLNFSTAQRVKLREYIEKDEWVTVLQYKNKTTNKWYTRDIIYSDMVGKYFLSKDNYNTTPTKCYLHTWDSQHTFNELSLVERLAVHRLYCEMIAGKSGTGTGTDRPDGGSRRKRDASESDPESTSGPQAKKKRIQTAKEVSIQECVDKLVEKRIVTVEDWMLKSPESYVRVLAMPGGEGLSKNILEISGLHVSRSFTAWQLLREQATDTEYRYQDSKLWDIFYRNNYNPIKVLHAIICVLNKQSGKRNTVLFYGPATTGKSLIAQAICGEIGNVGCYNPANVNFPFNDCTNKNVIWVEECCNFGQQVNQFKAVCSGQAIRVDQKGKGSKPLYGTPVIMTTNEDITRVIIGCEERPEHTEPIKARMVGIPLMCPLPGDFGLLESGAISSACKWMDDQGYQPTMACYLEKWGTLPTWGESWHDPPVQIPEAKRLAFSPIPEPEETVQAIQDLVKALEEDLAKEAQEGSNSDVRFEISSESKSDHPDSQPGHSPDTPTGPSPGGGGTLPQLVAYSSDSTSEEEEPRRLSSYLFLSVSHA